MYENQDHAYDDVDADGRPALQPQRGPTSSITSGGGIDGIGGDDDLSYGRDGIDLDDDLPPRCKACRRWIHRSRKALACPLSSCPFVSMIQNLLCFC